MSKFEQVGVNILLGCKTMEELDDTAKAQCDRCMNMSRCLWHDCSKCAIRQTKYLYGAYLYDVEYGADK